MSQSVWSDPVWSSLNQPAMLLIWTRIERWDWTILIFLIFHFLEFPPSLHPSLHFYISLISLSFWKMALKSRGTITSLQLSIFSSEIIWAHFLKLTAWREAGFVLSFDQQLSFKSYSVLPGGQVGKKNYHWSFIWALNQKKKHNRTLCRSLTESVTCLLSMHRSIKRFYLLSMTWEIRRSKAVCIEKYIRTWHKRWQDLFACDFYSCELNNTLLNRVL